MKKRKNEVFLAVVLVLALVLSGCGRKAAYDSVAYTGEAAYASSYGSYDYMAEAVSFDSEYAYEPAAAPAEAYGADEAKNTEGGSAYGESISEVGNQVQNSGQKKVYRSYLSIESTDFDSNYNAIMAKLDECGGYVSNSDMTGGVNYDGTPRYRSASLELKVPAAKYREFLAAGESFGNIVSKNENVEDITSSYLDVEARISSLEAEEDRLLELLKQTGTLEELLAVEERLADVRYEIERYTSTRNTYDSWVNFCTVTVEIREVNRTTPVKETFGGRIASAFSESWAGAADFFRDLAVGIVYALPTLIIIAVIVIAVIVIIKKTKPRRQQKARIKAELKNAAKAQETAVQTEAE